LDSVGIFSRFPLIHVTGRDHPDQIIPNHKRDEEPAVCIRPPQSVIPLFLLRVPCIWSNDQGQIEKDLFTFTIGDLMKVPVLVLVSFIPLEAFAVGDGFFHGIRILQQYTLFVKVCEVPFVVTVLSSNPGLSDGECSQCHNIRSASSRVSTMC
jgi:hypothetical protein